MKVTSREVTYRCITEQVFFEDGTELCITMGTSTSGNGSIDVAYDWADKEPDWANSIELSSLINYEAIY